MTQVVEFIPLSIQRSQVFPQNVTVNNQGSTHRTRFVDNSQIPFIYDSAVDKSEKQNGTCTGTVVRLFFIFFILGFIICGIPLVVITFLYVQKTNTLANNSRYSDPSSYLENLPTECSNYYVNTDSTRLTSFTECTNCIYDTSAYLQTGWYRFIETAGTQLTTRPSNIGTCGTLYPSWYNGTLPFIAGSTISTSLCVNFNGNLCDASYILPISITNCYNYYVFYLHPISYTGIRYCTSY